MKRILTMTLASLASAFALWAGHTPDHKVLISKTKDGLAFLLLRGPKSVACAKLHHQNQRRCIFCEFQEAKPEGKAVRISTAGPLTRV